MHPKIKQLLRVLRALSIIPVATLVIYGLYGIVRAGSLTPSASPAATGYTLGDIYTRLTTNATATQGNHSFSPGGSPAGTLYTLTQIYSAIPTIDPTKVLSGTSYLGVAGTASAGYAYGDDSPTKVLTTAVGAGTYNAANLNVNIVKNGTAFGVSLTGELTPASGASESLTLTAAAAVCGYKYFGSGATSWVVQQGSGCAVCRECSGGGCVSMTNNTQDTTNDLSGISGTCNETCKKCSGGSCVNQSSGEDLFGHCGGSSCCGYCGGSGACAYVASGQTCATPGDSCSGGYMCNGSGACVAWSCGNTLVDSRDGKQYATVLIGSQCWMKQGINVGTRIAGSSSQTNNGVIEKYCYSDTDANCNSNNNPNYPDGGLYQWAEAMQYVASCNGTGQSQPACSSPVQGICPAGWHIPSHYELVALERAVCTSGTCTTDFPYDTSTTGWRGTNEGNKLKTNGSSGFEGNFAGWGGSFGGRGSYLDLWTSLESGSSAWRRGLGAPDVGVVRDTVDKAYAFTVRCLKN
jgi:uncharacterized protein (TIGR02145 family)